ncbi:MAG: GNAT family N-acetyltransferase [Dermatophilaceae bacterium]|nr:GNAT family N-acetyltransferase [Dermatophilaceae bacterium]
MAGVDRLSNNRQRNEASTVQAARATVTLREITDVNRADILRLAVAPEQTELVDGVASSLAEAAANPDASPWFRAIYADEIPVGFVMLADGVPPGHSEFGDRYYLWRLLIDAGHQRHGYGATALDLVVQYVRGRPGAVGLVTSAVPGCGSPIRFYERLGFHPTGTMHGDEHVLVLQLS